MRTPVTDRYGLGTFLVGDGPQGDLDFRLGGIGAIGHPGFVIPGYQALPFVVPTTSCPWQCLPWRRAMSAPSKPRSSSRT
jgi:hypothetical protein